MPSPTQAPEKQKQDIDRSPHPIAIAFVDRIIPESSREHVRDILLERGLSSCEYVGWGLLWLGFLLASQFWPAFNLPLVLTEGVALTAAFAERPWGQPTFIAVAAGLTGLMVCDAYFYVKSSDNRSVFHYGIDTGAALLFLVAVETYETIWSPATALPSMTLARGTALALLMVSVVRAFFRQPPHLQPLGTASPKMTYLMTVLWMAAGVTAVVTYLDFGPHIFTYQDYAFGFFPVASFGIAFRLQKNALERTFGRDGGKVIFKDYSTVVLNRQLYWAWTPPDMKPSDFPWHTFMEFAGFGWLASPMIMTLVAWPFGIVAPLGMDWLAWGTNTCALAALFLLWPCIRKANLNLARAIQEKKNRRKAGL